MRPRGEIRLAVETAADTLVRERGCFTTRDVAQLAQVGFEKARRTVHDVIDAGGLVVVDSVRMPGVNRPVNLLTRPQAVTAGPAAELLRAVRSWAEFR